jgi:hypothetical protein
MSLPLEQVAPKLSVNATANGVAPGPRGCQAYHHPRGPSATPSSARYSNVRRLRATHAHARPLR